MSRRRSLARVLAGQWIVFGLSLLAGFALVSVLLLYMLEDAFIDRRLREASRSVAQAAQAPVLPGRFEVVREDLAPPPLRRRMDGLRDGAIREFRLDDGRYVHVMASRDHTGRRVLISYDVSDQLNVNAALAQGWPWLLLAAAVLALMAYALARRFVGGVSRQAGDLLARVMDAEGPAQLRTLAGKQAIHEFSELARLSAEAWEVRLSALERERETLAFLAHELRTPLQSARTSLALLGADRGNAQAWQRLQRAQDRLARASHAALWLGTAGPTPEGVDCRVAPVLASLLEEFEPLAATKQQQFIRTITDDVHWPMPVEVVETVLANLLLNAIQHGGPGQIGVVLESRGLRLSNLLADSGEGTGFGLGRVLVQRLLERFGWWLWHGDAGGDRHVAWVVPAGQDGAPRW